MGVVVILYSHNYKLECEGRMVSGYLDVIWEVLSDGGERLLGSVLG